MKPDVPRKTKKIRFIDDDDMHLVTGTGKPEIIKKGMIKEYPENYANMMLRSTRRAFTEHKDKKGSVINVTWKDIPRWEEVKEKGGK